MCIDKDILKKGNKIYSPQTCVFVPKQINSLFVFSKSRRGNLPVGVSYDKEQKKYQAYYTVNGKHIRIGRYDNLEEAFLAYKKRKEKYLKEVADLYKDKIPKKLYDAMYNWEISITD